MFHNFKHGGLFEQSEIILTETPENMAVAQKFKDNNRFSIISHKLVDFKTIDQGDSLFNLIQELETTKERTAAL
jgi:hypothetical protein